MEGGPEAHAVSDPPASTPVVNHRGVSPGSMDGGLAARPAGGKKEARVALIRRLGPRGPLIVFVLRGTKGLEKVFVLRDEGEVARVLERFSAMPLEVGDTPSAALEGLPQRLREFVANYSNLLERLSSELAPLLG